MLRLEITPLSLALFLVALGLWQLVKNVWHLGWGFTAGTLAVLALVSWGLHLRRRDSIIYLLGGWLLVAWALFAVVAGLLGSLLPGALWLSFLGLGFLIFYALHTRPVTWPLIPAVVLGALGVVLALLFTAISLTLRFAYVLVPLALIAWGLSWLLKRKRTGKDTGGWE